MNSPTTPTPAQADAVPEAGHGLRWHLLTAIVSNNQFVEVMAATSIDGIGVIVRWVLNDGAYGYRCEAIDTEGCEWAPVDFSQEGNEIPPMPPSAWDDTTRYLQP